MNFNSLRVNGETNKNSLLNITRSRKIIEMWLRGIYGDN